MIQIKDQKAPARKTTRLTWNDTKLKKYWDHVRGKRKSEVSR